MVDRREFIKCALSAGLLVGSGIMLTGCSGVRRDAGPDELPSQKQPMQLTSSQKTILYYASLAPSGHNSQPWRVRIVSHDSMLIEADPERRLPAVDPQNRELLLSLGAFVENMVLAAKAVGHHADVQVVAHDRQDRDVVRIRFRRDAPGIYPIWRLEKRRTVKHGHLPKELSSKVVKALARHAGDGLYYFPRGTQHAACMREAAVENYRLQTYRDEAQSELIQWLRLSDKDVRRYRDGLSTEGMEIRGFKGWFLRSFVDPEDFLEPGYREQGVDMIADLAGQGAGWLVLTSAGESVSDLIETGRRFERMALAAREMGIGIHPMTQVLEEKNGASQIFAQHGPYLFPQFVLRVGYLETYPDPVSMRRPVDCFAYC